MSGHSKWATIKRQKGTADIKRGQIFTKIANAITIAVKTGAGNVDPGSNFKLRLAIEKARAANVPKENIERAIRHAGSKQASEMEEVIYEGFTRGGVSVIVEAITDNSQRTTNEIKNIFRRVGFSFGQPGSVAYQFENIGKIIIKKSGKSFSQVFECAAESGAEDVEDAGDDVFVYTDHSDLSKIRDKLAEMEFEIEEAQLIRKPFVNVSIQDKAEREKITNFLHEIENLDDVQKVYSNLR